MPSAAAAAADPQKKIKLILAIVAITFSVGFLAYYYGLLPGGSSTGAGAGAVSQEVKMTPEQEEELEEIMEEQRHMIETQQIPVGGS